MPGQHSSHLPAFAFDSWNGHRIIGCGLVSHPSDHGCFRPLLHRNSFRSGNSAASNRRGMFGDGVRHLLSQISAIGMETEERHDCTEEIFDVLGLNFVSTQSVLLFAFDVGFCRPLGFQFFTNPMNRGRRCPDALREDFSGSSD
jgi:hypothetical protein